MNKPGSIFEDFDDGPTLGPKKGPANKPEVSAPIVEPSIDQPSPKDLREEQEAAAMRELASETGFAGKSVYQYTANDHRDAARKVKTFTGNPETALKCLKEFCKVHGVSDKDAFFEALQLLGEKHDFTPLKNLPPWSKVRKK